ncbi:hypothetical protein SAMN05421824_2537 [Hyunsoonleella jejuensis]|uniref:NIPSNAP protein n=1 Tax=Hyunsoonleella jejuensis TaxID=419940 RepID=A0A1H9JIG7_9FLAO|nr:hypothetical protein [Hyunsoonleella jejuensis]SEQ86573.1 hypothetical protein SAMN05421824_2537 [Hyunsoonleella jejuensis]
MKKSTILLATCLVLIFQTALAQEDESFLMDLSTFTIKFGHNSNFVDGVKKWNKCYKDNDGKGKWNVWHRQHGKTNEYVMASRLKNWAEMEVSDDAGKACRAIALNSVIPFVESVEYTTSESIPEYSRKTPAEDMALVWVYNFKVKNSTLFNEVIKGITSAISSKEGDKRAFWYRNLTGEGSTYFVSTPFAGYAELDKENDGVWKVYESVHGKSKTEELRNKFRASMDSYSSYIYTLEKDLSMM